MAWVEEFEIAVVAGDRLLGIEEKVADLPKLLGPRCCILPAQSEIECQLVGELIVILKIQAVVLAVDLQGRTETEVAGNRSAQQHAGQAESAGRASLGGIGPLRIDPVEVIGSRGGDRVKGVQTHQFEIGAYLDLMAVSQPCQVILQLPGVLRDVARLGTRERTDIGRTATLDGEAGAHHILLNVDGGELFVLDGVGDACGKAKGRDVKARAGGSAVVLNSRVAHA